MRLKQKHLKHLDHDEWEPEKPFCIPKGWIVESEYHNLILHLWSGFLRWANFLNVHSLQRIMDRIRAETPIDSQDSIPSKETPLPEIRTYLIHNSLDTIRTFLGPVVHQIGNEVAEATKDINRDGWQVFKECKAIPNHFSKWRSHICAFKHAQDYENQRLNKLEQIVNRQKMDKAAIIFFVSIAVLMPIDDLLNIILMRQKSDDFLVNLVNLVNLEDSVSTTESESELKNQYSKLLDEVTGHLKSRLSRIAVSKNGATKKVGSIKDAYDLVQERVQEQYVTDPRDTPQDKEMRIKTNIVQILAQITTQACRNQK